MTDTLMIFITASSDDEAALIAKTLVDEHLVACVNIISGVRSFFFWEGKTQDAREVLLICKSSKERMAQVIARVKSLHSYTVPEIVALPVAGGAGDYLAWVRETVQP